MMNQSTRFKMAAHRLFTILFTTLLLGFSFAQEAAPESGDVVLELGDWKVTHEGKKPPVDFGAPVIDEGLSPLWKLAKPLLIFFAIVAVLILLLMRFLPDHPLVRHWMLPNVTSGDGTPPVSSTGGTSIAESDDLLGLEGIARTELRPTGKGLFGERMLDIITDADFIEDGAKVRIVAIEGSRVVVEVAS